MLLVCNAPASCHWSCSFSSSSSSLGHATVPLGSSKLPLLTHPLTHARARGHLVVMDPQRRLRPALPNVIDIVRRRHKIQESPFSCRKILKWEDSELLRGTARDFEFISSVFILRASPLMLDRLGLPQYIELAPFSEYTDRGLWWIRQIRGFCSKHFPGIAWDGLFDANFAIRSRVFLPAELALPDGLFLEDLLFQHTRPVAFLSLMVHIGGMENPIMCSCCCSRFNSTVSETREHVMTPFLGYVSFGSYQSGACSNCIYHGTQKDCSWVQFPGYRFQSPREATGPALLPLLGRDSERAGSLLHGSERESLAGYLNVNVPFAAVTLPFRRLYNDVDVLRPVFDECSQLAYSVAMDRRDAGARTGNRGRN